MESLREHYQHINGWGIDADPANEPTYPMKKWTGDDHRRLNYERPVLQPETVEVLHSNERPGLTAVFGTTLPPAGISGAVRRFAFRFSEGKWWHWLSLILADRINMVEGVVDDLKKGHVPNIPAERGWNAEWKYNRKGVLKNAALGAGILAAGILLLSYRHKRSRR